MSSTSLSESDIGKSIMEALRKAGDSAGASLEDIKKYFTSKQKNVPDMENIKSWLNGAVDKGFVSLSDGKYKLKDAKEYAKQAGQDIGSKISNAKSSDDEKKKPCSIC